MSGGIVYVVRERIEGSGPVEPCTQSDDDYMTSGTLPDTRSRIETVPILVEPVAVFHLSFAWW